MCQFSENLGREFIVGSDTFLLPVEGWSFINDYCCLRSNQLTVFGPFTSNLARNRLRRHLDYIRVAEQSAYEYLWFDSEEKMNTAKKLFGEMFGFGVLKRQQMKIGATMVLEEFSEAYICRPDEISQIEAMSGFKRQNISGYGIDLKYNLTSRRLTIYVRYSLVAVHEDALLLSILGEREEIDSAPS